MSIRGWILLLTLRALASSVVKSLIVFLKNDHRHDCQSPSPRLSPIADRANLSGWHCWLAQQCLLTERSRRPKDHRAWSATISTLSIIGPTRPLVVTTVLQRWTMEKQQPVPRHPGSTDIPVCVFCFRCPLRCDHLLRKQSQNQTVPNWSSHNHKCTFDRKFSGSRLGTSFMICLSRYRVLRCPSRIASFSKRSARSRMSSRCVWPNL